MTFSPVSLGYLALAFGLGYLLRTWLAASSRLAASQARRENEQRLELVLWSTGDELWELDLTRDQFTRTNPLRHLKASSHELVNQASTLRNEIMPDDRPEFDRALIAHLKQQTEFLDTVYRAKAASGEWRWLRTRGRVVQRDSSGRGLRMFGTTGDVTDFKHHEIELERFNHDLELRVQQRTEALHQTNQDLQATIDELRQAQRQLVHAEKLAALGRLVAGVAHEINTPLGIGVTAASFLEQEITRMGLALEENRLGGQDLQRFRQTALESSQLILRNLLRADNLVKSFKQVAVDQSSEQKRVIDLGVYLQEIKTSLRPTLKQHPFVVEINCQEGLLLETYPGAIYQIIVNLVLNAVTHAFPGRAQGVIQIMARRTGEWLSMTVRDDGVGMSDQVRLKIFEPFFTTTRSSGGSGLGLHIVWNLATQVLAGSIDCESAPGAGSCFELRFPLPLPVSRESAPESTRHRPIGREE